MAAVWHADEDAMARRRNPAIHLVLTVLLYLAWMSLGAVISVIVVTAIAPPTVATELERQQAIEMAVNSARGVFFLWTIVTLPYATTRVGYRGRDSLMAFIPIYGPLFFLPKIFWRFTDLPAKPWDAADSSGAAVAKVARRDSTQAVMNSSPTGPSLPPPPSPPHEAAVDPHPAVSVAGGANRDQAWAAQSQKRSRRWPLALAVAVPTLIVASVGSFAFATRGNTPTPPNSSTSAVQPPTSAPTSVATVEPIDGEVSACFAAKGELTDIALEVQQALTKIGDRFEAARGDDRKAAILEDGAAVLYVKLSALTVYEVPPSMAPVKQTLMDHLDKTIEGLGGVASSWRGTESAPAGALSSLKQGWRALYNDDELISDVSC